MENAKYYIYISNSKVDMLYRQIQLDKKINIDFKAALKFFFGSFETTVSQKEPSDNIYRKLNKVVEHLEQKGEVGSLEDIDKGEQKFYRIVDEFEYSESLKLMYTKDEDKLAPFCRFIFYRDYGTFNRLVYLVGSAAYMMTGERPIAPINVSDHSRYFLEDLDAQNWHGLNQNIIRAFSDRSFHGIKRRLETLFVVIYRSQFIDKFGDGKPYPGDEWRVVLGSPIYVAQV